MTVHVNDSDAPAIEVEHRDSLAIVRINQPTTRNSLSRQTLKELNETISALTPRKDIGAIIFTGTGDVFASGANISELTGLTPQTARAFAELGQSVFGKIAAAGQKTIAAVNGYCIGGGLDLAIACDLRCASTNAVFAHPGGQLGIITGWGGTQRLPRLIGTARALEMFTTARRISSGEALEFGLINRIGDPVLSCALDLIK